jgi:hypothetical protein
MISLILYHLRRRQLGAVAVHAFVLQGVLQPDRQDGDIRPGHRCQRRGLGAGVGGLAHADPRDHLGGPTMSCVRRRDGLADGDDAAVRRPGAPGGRRAEAHLQQRFMIRTEDTVRVNVG